ncbi:MAG: Bacterial regulatory protein arsR family [Phycisphaerales bacterium]|nr:Bacterial regulatory protein arsR family [Phycisphaerales bacterium]
MASRNKKNDPQPSNETQPATAAGESGRFAYEGLERVIHEKARLSIMSSLATHPDGLLFNDLKDLCSLTDGNLSRHMQLLQESKLVEVWKGFKNNRPQTLVRLTEAGRKRFLEYVQELEQVVADALAATGRAAAPARLPLSKGLSPA